MRLVKTQLYKTCEREREHRGSRFFFVNAKRLGNTDVLFRTAGFPPAAQAGPPCAGRERTDDPEEDLFRVSKTSCFSPPAVGKGNQRCAAALMGDMFVVTFNRGVHKKEKKEKMLLFCSYR